MANLKVSLENIIPLTEARDHFSQIVADVQKDKLYILTKGGKPAVAVIDVKYLEGITGGSVNTISIEAEIQKDPAKVGRVPMIKTTGNTNFIPKPTFNAPSFLKSTDSNSPTAKVTFEPSTPKPFTPTTTTTPSSSNTNSNSSTPKPNGNPYIPYKPPVSTPLPPKPFTPPTPTPTPPAFNPQPKPAMPPVPSPAAQLTKPTPPIQSTPVNAPTSQPKPYVSPYQANNAGTTTSPTPSPSFTPASPVSPATPTSPVTPPLPKPAEMSSSDSISISSPTPLSSVSPQPVNSPITMQNSPTNAPSNIDIPSAQATPPVPTIPTSTPVLSPIPTPPAPPQPTTTVAPASPIPYTSGSGLTMQSSIPSANNGSVIDVITKPKDLPPAKPVDSSIFSAAQAAPTIPAAPVVTGQSNNAADEPDDMVLD